MIVDQAAINPVLVACAALHSATRANQKIIQLIIPHRIGHEAKPREAEQHHRAGRPATRFCMFEFNDFNTLLHCNIFECKTNALSTGTNAARND
jgi:hypothetical protein